MPASDYPKATRGDNVRVIHIQRGDSYPTLGCLSTDDCAFFDPLEMVIPSFHPGVKEWNSRSTFRIYRLESICLVTIAHRAGQK